MKSLFFGGVHPEGRKELSACVPLAAMALPAQAAVLLRQHIGAPCKPLVSVGDTVCMGQKIGDGEGLCVPVHAPVSGVVEAASRLDDPDYDTLFRAMANAWASTSSRQTQLYLLSADVHAPDKLRVNRALQTVPEFYETYDIQPGDGMWVAPEERVSVW